MSGLPFGYIEYTAEVDGETATSVFFNHTDGRLCTLGEEGHFVTRDGDELVTCRRAHPTTSRSS